MIDHARLAQLAKLQPTIALSRDSAAEIRELAGEVLAYRERDLVAQVDRLMAAPSKIIAAFCSVCGGWTMFVTTESDNAKTWIGMCYVAGDLIMPISTADTLGGAVCPQTDIQLDERTCDR